MNDTNFIECIAKTPQGSSSQTANAPTLTPVGQQTQEAKDYVDDIMDQLFWKTIDIESKLLEKGGE